MDEVMYKTYAPLLYGIILRFTEDTGKADEILENSFGEISLHIPEFNGSDCRLFTWMMRITLNECIKVLGIPSALLKIRMMPFLALKSRSISEPESKRKEDKPPAVRSNANRFKMTNNIREIQEEQLRIKALKRYEILDTPKDVAFDRITRLAAAYLNVPIALISLVDEQRIWFKSRYGFEVQQIQRETGLCSSAILSDELFLIENTDEDPRTLNHPMVKGTSGLKFYAALPLKTRDGHNLGTLCIMDKQPRKLFENEISVLQDLRDTVMELLELRLAASAAVSQQRNLLNMAVHDLKNPLANISIRAQLIHRKKSDQQTVSELALQIREASTQMVSQVNNLLLYFGKELGDPPRHEQQIDLEKIIRKVVSSSLALASHKEQRLSIEVAAHPKVMGDELQLTEIIDNLVSNALKYCFSGGNINIHLQQSGSTAIIRVSDDGPGFSAEDHLNMFQRFARLSAKPTGEESSSGLGLSIVRQLAEQHGGRVYAEEKPEKQGAHLVVELPVII